MHTATICAYFSHKIDFWLSGPTSAESMAIQVVEFKLERFLHKNQHTQRKFLSFELMVNLVNKVVI